MFEVYKEIIARGLQLTSNGRIMFDDDDVHPALPALLSVIQSLRNEHIPDSEAYIKEVTATLRKRILNVLAKDGLYFEYAPHPLAKYLEHPALNTI